jgi:transcriptional regulator with XRE-family HTH domain
MGHARHRPLRLARKLLLIRAALGLSQSELHRRLGVHREIPYTRISDYELDKNEPPLTILLKYAALAGLHLEVIVDDQLDLPAKIPGPIKQSVPKRTKKAREEQY